MRIATLSLLLALGLTPVSGESLDVPIDPETGLPFRVYVIPGVEYRVRSYLSHRSISSRFVATNLSHEAGEITVDYVDADGRPVDREEIFIEAYGTTDLLIVGRQIDFLGSVRITTTLALAGSGAVYLNGFYHRGLELLPVH